MDYLGSFFKWCNQFGIANDSALLAIIGIAVCYFMWKQLRVFKKYHSMAANSAVRTIQLLEGLKEKHERIDDWHITCSQHEAPDLAQKETMKEKIDNVEDHLKEIKKTLLFK